MFVLKVGEVEEQFFQQLERPYDSVPASDTKMILSDLHAKVGKEMEPRGTTSTYCLHYILNDSW